MSILRRLASQSSLIFGARLAGAGLIFLVQAGMARAWGADILGEYLLLVASVNIAAVIMPLGFQTIGTYFAAEYRARGERHQLKAFLTRSYGQMLALAAVMVALGWPLSSSGMVGQALHDHFAPFALLAISTALVFLNGATLVGLKRPFAGLMADAIFRPMVIVAAFIIGYGALTPAAGFATMLWVIAAGYVTVALIHFGFVVNAVATIDDHAPVRAVETARWWRFALPWVLIALATDFFFDVDLLLLSHLLDRQELAIFGVCTRIFAIVSFGVAAVYAVTLPDMFESEANRDREGFLRKIGEANLVAAGLSVALFVAVLVGGPVALMLFGRAFVDGALPLAVLCLALVVRSVMGPASLVLSIHDRPYASLPAVALGMVALVAANLVMVPLAGLMGAALAALFAITVWSVVLWQIALRLSHIDVSLFGHLRSRARLSSSS